MEFIHAHSTARITRRVNIVDGPVMQHPNSSTGKKIRVTGASLDYVWVSGEWTTRTYGSAHINGVVLKTGGRDSKTTWGGPAAYRWYQQVEYAWLVALEDALRPEPLAALPFRLSGYDMDELEEI